MTVKKDDTFQTGVPAALLLDPDSDSILFEKNGDQLVAPASLAKLMTLEFVFNEIKQVHRFRRIQWLYWKPNAMIRISRPIPTRKIKLVLFDLDGTLIDSERDLAAAVNAMLVKYGRKELPIEVIGTYIGDGAPMLIRRALGDPADREFLQEALNFFLQYYRDHKLDTTCLYAGIREALQQIGGNHGVPRQMAVLTNKPVRVSRDILAGLGVDGSFFQVYGGNSFDTKKPDPLGANTLIKEAGVSPEETVMVGDSQVDILTARNAGMWSVGVTYGFAPRTLEQVVPDVLVDTPAELATALSRELP